MIDLDPDEDIEAEAKRRLEELDRIPAVKRRRFASESCSMGLLAEVAILRRSDLFVADGIRHDFTRGNNRYELKTSVRNIQPRPTDTAKIPASYLEHAKRSGTTHLIFASVNKKTRRVTLCGSIEVQSFEKKASYFAKGEIPPGDSKKRNCDTFQIEYCKLYVPRLQNGVIHL